MTREQEALVIQFEDFARNVGYKVAGKLLRSSVFTMEDALQEAKTGLVEAARRFDFQSHDSSKSTMEQHFKSFAYPRIRGAVIDAARRATFVGRRGLENGVEITMVYLDDRKHHGDEEDAYQVELSAVAEDVDLVLDFGMAFKKLSEREQYVLMGLGVGTSGKEIAAELGVTESRISQIATDAKAKLRRQMDDV